MIIFVANPKIKWMIRESERNIHTLTSKSKSIELHNFARSNVVVCSFAQKVWFDLYLGPK